MARPIWSGVLSFGLLNVPVQLMTAERRTDIHFRMLDCRNNAPVRYERLNSETGEEVPWNDICKAYEYEKGNFVVLNKEDLAQAGSAGREAIEIESFVELDAIDPRHFEKPYMLLPGKKADKGYVLLRDTLERSKKVGIARIVIRTREYLCAVIARENALVVMLMRFAEELVAYDEYKFPTGKPESYRIQPREFAMARELIESMSTKWNPEEYKDQFAKRMHAVIDKRLKSGGKKSKAHVTKSGAEESTNVVDFMSLLHKSIAANRRSPAQKSSAGKKATKTLSAKAKRPAKKKVAGSR
jgi:DNA end-binding protein Ku